MNRWRKEFFGDDRVCPWWLAWTFDNPLRRYLQNPWEIVGPYLHEGMTVADIGCGMGYFSIAMAKMTGESGSVIAVDLQRKMLDLLMKRATRAGVADRIHPVLAEKDDIGTRAPVDFVLAFWMVHEVKDIPRFFGQIFSILKSGGNILYAEPRIHVADRRFRELLGKAEATGFRVSKGPRVRFSRTAILSKENEGG